MPAPSVKQSPPLPSLRDQSVERERQLQRALIAYIVTGLFFMLLPGTFLGVWNLISISSRHALESLFPAWLQAHGHAQIFGWIGTFILGIGFYSLSKMGKLPPFAVWRAWRPSHCGLPVRRCDGSRAFPNGSGAFCCRFRRCCNCRHF